MEVASLMANILLVLVTTCYVVLTYSLVKEARATRLASTKSHVVVDVELDPATTFLLFVVKNTGRSPATDISARIDPPLLDDEGQDVSTLANITGLGGGQGRTYFLDSGHEFFERGRPLRHDVSITWKDPVEGNLTSSYKLDLASFKGVRVGRGGIEGQLKEIVRALGRIEKKLSR